MEESEIFLLQNINHLFYDKIIPRVFAKKNLNCKIHHPNAYIHTEKLYEIVNN